MPSTTHHHILVLQLGGLGDLVASRRGLAGLGLRFPGASIEVVVRDCWIGALDEGAAGVRWHPYPARLDGAGFRRVLALAVGLRRGGRPDLCLDLTGSPPARWLSFLAGSRRRIGWGRSWFYHGGTEDPRRREAAYEAEIERLLLSVGISLPREIPYLAPLPVPMGLEARLGLGREPLVVLHPGAANPLRRWGVRRCAALLDLFVGRGLRSLVLGGPGDGDLLDQISAASASRPPCYSCRDLGELRSLLGRASVVVAMDSGPMHLAAAMGIPVVALFGPNIPSRAAPRSRVLRTVEVEMECRPCGQRVRDCLVPHGETCMDRLDPGRVADTVIQSLRESGW